jgi:glucose 1-dehydrogenase
MVNNAGIETRTSLLETTEDQYEEVLTVNLKSAFFGTQLAAKQMIKQGGGGHIINITSVHEDWPMPGNIAYCLSKGGMRMLTRTAGVELAPHNILVVGVGPGAVATPINRATMANPAEMARLDARSRWDVWHSRTRSPTWSACWRLTKPATSPRPRFLRTAV